MVDTPNPEHVLNTITDDPGRKIAERLFKHYVRDEAHVARLPAFLIVVDRALTGMGGVPAEPVPPTDEGEYEDDEDLHAEHARDEDAESIRAAVGRAIANAR